jgi:hypothetical protein
MATITDEYMQHMLAHTRNYGLVILKPGPNKYKDGAEKIIWEHGRRNLELRADGKVCIVCPIPAGSDIAGIVIFNAEVEEVRKIMAEDPAVKAQVLSYEVYECRSFPEDYLPK